MLCLGCRTMDAVSLLIQQHRQVDQLFDEFESQSDIGRRLEIIRQVKILMSKHASLEEAALYPIARMVLPGRSQELDHDLEEHNGTQTCRIWH